MTVDDELPGAAPDRADAMRPEDDGSTPAHTPLRAPLPEGWRWHADWDASIGRRADAIARDRTCPFEPASLDRLLTALTADLGASGGSWTLERRGAREHEAHTVLEVLGISDRAHVRLSLLRDRHGHDHVTATTLGAHPPGELEPRLARAIDRALDAEPARPVPLPAQPARKTRPSDVGHKVVSTIASAAGGRPSLPLGWRWNDGAARLEGPFPRGTAETSLLFDAASDLLSPADPTRWTRTWRAGGAVLLRATLRAGLDESAVDVRLPADRTAEPAILEVRGPSPEAITSVARALDEAGRTD